MTRGGRANLRGRLARGSLPLAIALVVVVTVSAPTAYYVLSVSEIETRATSSAATVANLFAGDAGGEPDLWRYNSIKILRHVRAFRVQAGDTRVEVVDGDGAAIDLGPAGNPPPGQPLVWGRAPVHAGSRVVGTVWVALSVRDARRNAMLLALGFLVLGLLLGGLTYGIPLRIVGVAEGQIVELLGQLERSQSDLERQVAERVADLGAAYESLKHQDVRMRELASRAASSQEAERRRIARDLHDSTGQVLTAVRINVQLLADRATQGQDIDRLAATTIDLADSALEEVRRAVRSLGPSILDEVGLPEALARMCADVSERSQVAVDCGVEVGAELSEAVEATCYRITQEALTNVERHAAASCARVRLHLVDGVARVEVTDDGRGFDAGTTQGRGLSSMRERAELLGGRLRVDTTVGDGTRVVAELPVGGRQSAVSRRPGDGVASGS